MEVAQDTKSQAWAEYDAARKAALQNPAAQSKVAAAHARLAELGLSPGRTVNNIRLGFKIEDPKVVYCVEFADGTKTSEYGTNWCVGDIVEVAEHITCVERNIPLPQVRQYCRENRAVLIVELHREGKTSRRPYPST